MATLTSQPPLLLLTGLLSMHLGCLGGDAPHPSARADAAVKAPRVVLPWDGCSKDDPDPWPWRPRAQGLWGEDPARVPDFEYEQERRAPKVPDVARYLHALAPTKIERIDGALLLCEVEIYSHDGHDPAFYRYKLGAPNPARPACKEDWDLLGSPDVLLRFKLRDAYPIALFGPEDHWGFFISIPSISLAAGDSVRVKLWDRDSGTFISPKGDSTNVEFMGEARLTFDGRLPMDLRGPFFALRCHAMSAAQTAAAAKPWLTSLEHTLARAEDWEPDINRYDLGDSGQGVSATLEFGRGTFRYPAGFLGWDHPEIQSRLARLRALPAADARKRAALVAALPRKEASPAQAARAGLSVTSYVCEGAQCTAELALSPALRRELSANDPRQPHRRLAAITAQGEFSAVTPEAPASADAPLRVKLPAASRWLWLGGTGAALVLPTGR